MANVLKILSTADGTSPELQADGSSDTNVDLILTPKGTGKVKVGSTAVALITDVPDVSGKEDASNKKTSLADDSDTFYPSQKAVKTAVDAKLSLAGGTMTGKIVSSGSSEVGKTYTPATGAQTVALDCALNNVHIVTGHADGTAITFTVANATNSQPFIVSILQGAVVSTIAGWFATVRWAGGSAPTLTATVGKRDTFGFIRTGADTYDGFIIGQNC